MNMSVPMSQEMFARIKGKPKLVVVNAIKQMAGLSNEELLRLVIAQRNDDALTSKVTVSLPAEEAAMLNTMDRRLGTRNKALIVRAGVAHLLANVAA
jgi:hypothetical protein